MMSPLRITGLTLVAIAGLAFVLLSPTSARALTCIKYNVTAYQNDGFHRGNEVTNPGIWIAPNTDPVTCLRVSSIFLVHSYRDEVEFGWIRVSDTVVDQCNQSGGSNPWRLTFLLVNDEPFCPEGLGVHLNGNQYRNFAIKNLDGDDHFDFWYNDTYIVTNSVNANFSTGWSLVNGERRGCSPSPCTADIAYSIFNGIQYQSWSGFHPWNQSAIYCDNDPDWYPHLYASDWWQVESGVNANIPCTFH